MYTVKKGTYIVHCNIQGRRNEILTPGSLMNALVFGLVLNSVRGTLGSYATEHWVGFFVVRVYGRFFRIILQCKGISVVVHGLKIFSLKNLILFSYLCPKKNHKIKLTTLSFNFDYIRFRNKAFWIKIFWIIEKCNIENRV